MGSKRQPTLMETWRGGARVENNAVIPAVPAVPRFSNPSTSRIQMPPNRGCGRGRGQVTNFRGQAQYRVTRGRGRGRGRGRDSTSTKFNSSLSDISFIEDDDDDDICLQAIGQFELNTSDLSKAFETANNATELPGFDKTAGGIWIYPTNKPVRDYQFQIVQTALFNNTLVSLPTGMGKTFIAAVLMYNFHRWYPQDLIIFMAPTRPLVTQQLEACHNIVGIHPSKTVELTGHIAPKKRDDLWKTKSVFFLTPQVMTSDLTRGVCPLEKVRCIVVDEAHRALGQHAYAQVIAMLSKTNTLFRVLALSATPGSDLAAVQQVLKNLLISRVELRSENSPDILPYNHDREKETVVVSLKQNQYLTSVYNQMLEIYQNYTGKLLKQKALLARDPSSLTHFQLLKARETFRSTMAQKFPNYVKGYIELDFATSMSLAHSIELLECHGLRTFYIFLQGIFNKEKGSASVAAELKKNTELPEILSNLQQKLNISTANSTFNMNSSSLFTTISKNADLSYNSTLDVEVVTDYMLSHPKMEKLKDIVLKHFKSFETKNETTRVMIFSQYRDSVQEIGNMLSTLGNQVKPMVFIGQANVGGGGKGLKQKDQVKVIQHFREGGFNVLVSTCVGEEGLDIGEVDLIICFDASRSPTRLVQRMGRTGRQRTGRIVFLLSEGRESRSYSSSISLHNSISRNITDPVKLYPFLYKFSPRMVPLGVEPHCFKMNVVLTSEQTQPDEEVIVVEDDGDDTLSKPKQTKTVVENKKKIKAASSFTSKPKKATSRPGTAGSSSSATSSETQSERTPTQGFEQLFKKSSTLKTSVVQVPQEYINTNRIGNEDKDNNNLCNRFDDEDCYMTVDDTDVDFLCDIFDVIDPSKVVPNPCLHIPKPPELVKWLPEYNELDVDTILLKDFDLDCVKEKLESYELITLYREKCKCGNVNSNQEFTDLYYDDMGADDLELLAIQSQEFSTWDKEIEDSVAANNNSFVENLDVDPPPISQSPDIVKKMESQRIGLDDGFTFDEKDPLFDDSSTTSNDAEFQSPIWKKKLSEAAPKTQTILDGVVSQNISHSQKISQPQNNSFSVSQLVESKKKIIGSKQSKQGNLSPPKFEIVLDDSSNNSSTTSNDENFQSPIWKKKLSEAVSNQSRVVESKEASQFHSTQHKVNRDLFKDDLLLFEDDDEDDILLANINISQLTTTAAQKNKELHKSHENTKDNFQSPSSFIFCPPTPPRKIFSFNSATNSKSSLLPDSIVVRKSTTVRPESVLAPESAFMPETVIVPESIVIPETILISNREVTSQNTNSSFKKSMHNLESSSSTSQNGLVGLPPPAQTKRTFQFKHKQIHPPPPSGNTVPVENISQQKSNGSVSMKTNIVPRVQPHTPVQSSYVSNSTSQVDFAQKKSNKLLDTSNSNNAAAALSSSVKAHSQPDKSKFHFRQKGIPPPPAPPSSSNKVSIFTKSSKSFETNKVNNNPQPTKSSAPGSSSSLPLTSKGGSKFKFSYRRNFVRSPSPDFKSNPKKELISKKELSREPHNISPVTPKRSQSSFRQNFVSSPEAKWISTDVRQKTPTTSILSSSPVSTIVRPKKKSKKRRKLNENPYLDLEAEASEDGSSVDEADEFEGLDDFDDSFVDQESPEHVTGSQQVRYIKSVKDIIPINHRSVTQSSLSITERGTLESLTVDDFDADDYEKDSFCVTNDDDVIDYTEIGNFTQAMNEAREEVMKENPSSTKRIITRRQARAKQVVNLAVPFNANSANVVSKKRRRIIVVDSSEED